MALTPEVKKEIVAKYGNSATDTGSPEAQIALLSKRVDEITFHLQIEFTKNPNFKFKEQKI